MQQNLRHSRYSDRDCMTEISERTFSDALSSIEVNLFWLELRRRFFCPINNRLYFHCHCCCLLFGLSSHYSWWRNQMETSSELLVFCAWNSRCTVNSPHKGQQREVFFIFIDRRINKRLSKQSWGWWFDTSSRSLWHHCNGWLDIGFNIHVIAVALSPMVLYVDLLPTYHGIV